VFFHSFIGFSTRGSLICRLNEKLEEAITCFFFAYSKMLGNHLNSESISPLPSTDTSSYEALSTDFRELGLSENMCLGLRDIGIVRPTEIQSKCIPLILKGNDVIGTARTGNGKTACFTLPILHLLSKDPYGIFAVCLTPTRELACQVGEQFALFGGHMTFNCLTIVGGEDFRQQSTHLANRPHVIVATPGRLMEHFLYDRTLSKSFKNMKCLVMDEADRLLEPSFEGEFREILKNLPASRQTILFSATITRNISMLQELTLDRAIHIEIIEKVKVEQISVQEYCFVQKNIKIVYLDYILNKVESWGVRNVMIFAGSIRTCQLIGETLKGLNLNVVILHANLKQKHRVKSLNMFKSGAVRVMISTDVASRGLDIPTVDLVINADVPLDPSDYIHRVGRTARNGRSGRSITLITQYDINLIKNIENSLGRKLTKLIYDDGEVLKNLSKVFAAQRRAKYLSSV
jgi:ATP-dependent RNA helicase DDX49/DBP8